MRQIAWRATPKGDEIEVSKELRTRARDIDGGSVELTEGEDFLKRLRVV